MREINQNNIKFEQQTIDCIAQHIKTFHEQSKQQIIADFGEPCTNCEYGKICNLDWLAKMKPLFEKSDVMIKLCDTQNFHK